MSPAEPLLILTDDDLLAEMTLMRAELELLKKELRRLAAG